MVKNKICTQTMKVFLLITLISIVVGAGDAYAASTGGKCSKAGLTQTTKGVKYKCTKSGKSLNWVAQKSGTTGSQAPSNSAGTGAETSAAANWRWADEGSKWVSSGSVPACTFPIIADGSFANFGTAISKDQPGQIRGGSYKPHGTIRWSNQVYVPGIDIRAPFDGVIVAAWHYLVEGQYQFGVNFVSPCGFMIRIGHLNSAGPKVASILSKLSPAMENDSRESNLQSPVALVKGDVIATAVGIPSGRADSVGTFVDFALLDLRSANQRTLSSVAAASDVKYSRYAVCWYEGQYLGNGDKAKASALAYSNGDSASDYCQK